MFGFKVKPDFLLKTLKNFGFDVSVMLPKLEAIIIREADKLEAKTGKDVCVLATRDRENNKLLISLCLQEENGSLSVYQTFPFEKLVEILLNEMKNANNSSEPTTQIPATTGTSSRGNDTAEPTAEPGDAAVI